MLPDAQCGSSVDLGNRINVKLGSTCGLGKMPLSMQSKFEEKRFALRMALRLPIVVSGRSEDGAAWSEPTETDDILLSVLSFNSTKRSSRAKASTFVRIALMACRSK